MVSTVDDQYAFVRDDADSAQEEAQDDQKTQEQTHTSTAHQSTKQIGLNLNFDMGCLLLEDCQSYSDITAKEFSKRTASNICAVYKQLFDLKKKQDAQFGPDGQILEHDRAAYAVDMPPSEVVLPREKPCPVEKPKTKWERFREERGLPPRRKRSYMVFDELT